MNKLVLYNLCLKSIFSQYYYLYRYANVIDVIIANLGIISFQYFYTGNLFYCNYFYIAVLQNQDKTIQLTIVEYQMFSIFCLFSCCNAQCSRSLVQFLVQLYPNIFRNQVRLWEANLTGRGVHYRDLYRVHTELCT